MGVRRAVLIFFSNFFTFSLLSGGEVNKFITSNGITVLHREINNLPILSVYIFARGGNLYERKDNYGVTSLALSLITKGTKTRTAEQIAIESENIGTSISAGTDKDFATVGLSVLKEHLDKAIELLSDVVLNPVFPDAEIKKEKTMLLASIETRKDRIFTVADDLSNKTFYGSHPYAVPEIGTKETVRKIDRKKILDFYKDLFTAGNIIISIAGDLTLDEAKRIIERYFSSIAAGAAKTPISAKIKPTKKNVTKKYNFQQAYLMISFPAPSVGEDNYATLKVLNGVLGGRMSGRLFRNLREKLSLAYEVNAFYPTRAQNGKFTLYMGLDAKNIHVAKKELETIINDIKNNTIEETELAETKKYLKGIYSLQRQTVERKAWYNGFWEIMGMGYQYDNKYLETLMSVSAEDIKSAANKYFSDDTKLTVEILPK